MTRGKQIRVAAQTISVNNFALYRVVYVKLYRICVCVPVTVARRMY